MKKTLKTIDIVNAYNKIKGAKLNKMEDKDKFALIRISKKLKAVATDYEGFDADARERLKPEDFDAMAEKLQNRQRLEAAGHLAETDEEKAEVMELNVYFGKFQKAVDECVKPEKEKEVELEYEALSEDAFGAFLTSNDFTIGEGVELSDILCE